jgi:hypothetical protein
VGYRFEAHLKGSGDGGEKVSPVPERTESRE